MNPRSKLLHRPPSHPSVHPPIHSLFIHSLTPPSVNSGAALCCAVLCCQTTVSSSPFSLERSRYTRPISVETTIRSPPASKVNAATVHRLYTVRYVVFPCVLCSCCWSACLLVRSPCLGLDGHFIMAANDSAQYQEDYPPVYPTSLQFSGFLK